MARINGTEGADFLVGTRPADTIFGLGGDDGAYGLDGNDQIDLGDGNDFGIGGPGNDWIAGQAGDDYLEGDDFDTTVPFGNDQLFGKSGDDALWGGGGAGGEGPLHRIGMGDVLAAFDLRLQFRQHLRIHRHHAPLRARRALSWSSISRTPGASCTLNPSGISYHRLRQVTSTARASFAWPPS